MPESKSDPVVGATIDGRYRVIARIAAGGMGVVYRAEQVFLKREVALKRLHGFLTGHGNSMVRFQREAQAAVKISHPNVCQVLDCGVDADGALYIAMELLDGQSLGQRISDYAPLPLGEIADVGAQICEGLGRAHALGIVHRDLKPDNVMLVPKEDGSGVVAKVMDFGVAKVHDDVEAKALTQAGMVFGTPKYMAPEQASGEPLDARADLYSLGVILYEMATGRPPFDAPTMGALLNKHLNAPIPALGDAAPHLEYPLPFRALVERCLAKRPEERFATAEALAAGLRACAELHVKRLGAPRPRPARDDLPTAIISGTPPVPSFPVGSPGGDDQAVSGEKTIAARESVPTPPVPPEVVDTSDAETRQVSIALPDATEAPSSPQSAGSTPPAARRPDARRLAIIGLGAALALLLVVLAIRGQDRPGPVPDGGSEGATASAVVLGASPSVPAEPASTSTAVAPTPPGGDEPDVSEAAAPEEPDVSAAAPSREELARAAEEERRAFAMRPDVTEALALDAAGKTTEAIARLEALAETLDGEAHYHFLLAGLLDKGVVRRLDALQHALRALALDPRYAGETGLHELAQQGLLEPSTLASAALLLERVLDARSAESLVRFILEHTRSVSTPRRVRDLLAGLGLLDTVPERLRLPLLVITDEDCEARKALLTEIAARPDAGMAPYLARFKAESGCGSNGGRDCWPCERAALREALAAVDAVAADE